MKRSTIDSSVFRQRYYLDCINLLHDQKQLSTQNLILWQGFKKPEQRTLSSALSFLWIELYKNRAYRLPKLRGSVVALTLRTLRQIDDAKAVAIILHRMAKVGVDWKREMGTQKEEVLSAISTHLKKFNHQSIANTLWALSKWGLSWALLTPKLRNALLMAIEANAGTFNSQEIANTLWALANLGISWESLTPGLRNHLLSTVADNAQAFNPQAIANTLWALANLGISWESLTPGLRNRLLSAVVDKARAFNHQGIANTLWALANLGISWESLTAELRSRLLSAIAANAQAFNPQNIANTLWALANLGISWESLTSGLRSRLLSAVAANAGAFNPQGIANTLWALVNLGISWGSLTSGLHSRLLSAIAANAGEFNLQGITNMLWAWSVFSLKPSCPELPIELKTSLHSLDQKFQEETKVEEIHQLFIAQELLGLNLPASLKKKVKAYIPTDRTTSELEKNVYQELKLLLPEIQKDQYEPAARHVIDMSWESKPHKVAFEVDGPKHFFFEADPSIPPLPNVNTQLRDRLLEKAGWQVVVISYWEWNRASDKIAYLQGILQQIGLSSSAKRCGKKGSTEEMRTLTSSTPGVRFDFRPPSTRSVRLDFKTPEDKAKIKESTPIDRFSLRRSSEG